MKHLVVCWSCASYTRTRAYYLRTIVGVKPVCGACKQGCFPGIIPQRVARVKAGKAGATR